MDNSLLQERRHKIKSNKPDTTPSPENTQGRSKALKTMSSPPSPSSPDPQVLQDLSPISGNSQLSGVATSTVPGASSTPMASTGGLPPGLGALATPLPGASGFSNRPGALARPPGVLVDAATPGVPHSSPGGVATPSVGAQGHNIVPGAAATPNTSTLDLRR